ncbi:MAG TPA: hypothetical protein P5244_09550, partial [Syntrophales bacterium]|nr:hypothetical protein [Syntrophales bacterium]
MTIRALILLTIGVICCGTALAAYQPDELVERLRKEQPIAALRPEQTAKALKENIDRNYVLIMFSQTGTELGITLDRGLCRLNEANFETAKGTVV